MPYKNTIANLLGQIWSAIMGIAFIPIFIKYLGIEAWGIIGFISVLQVTLSLLDSGMSPTISREMAKFTSKAISLDEIRRLFFSLEIIYAFICSLIIATFFLCSNVIAKYWFVNSGISRETLTLSFIVIGIIVSCRMMEQLYKGAMQGLQAQVWHNAANSVLVTMKWAGAAIVVVFWQSSLEAFLYWQAFVSLISLVVMRLKSYQLLPCTNTKISFDFRALKKIKNFAGGMGGITILFVILSQTDKFLLSKLVSLTDYGYYMFAATLAGSIHFFVTPITTAMLPHWVQLASNQQSKKISESYFQASQWFTLINLPISFMLFGYAEQIIYLWSANQTLASETAPLMQLLIVANLFNGYMNLPYTLQIAHGWTSLILKINSISVIFLVFMLICLIPIWGVTAAPVILCILYVLHFTLMVFFMHQKILVQEQWEWLVKVVLLPFACASVGILILKYSFVFPQNRALSLIILLINTIILFLLVSLTLPVIRKFVRNKSGIKF